MSGAATAADGVVGENEIPDDDPFANMRKPVLPVYDWLSGKQIEIVKDKRDFKDLLTWMGLVTAKASPDKPCLLSVDTETAGPPDLWNEAVRLSQRVTQFKALAEALPHKKRRTPDEQKLFDEHKANQAASEVQAKEAGARARQAGLCCGLLKVRLVQLYVGGQFVWVMDLFKMAQSGMDVPRALREVLGRADIQWVGHNIQFDASVIYQTANFLPAHHPHCTMLQSQALISLTHVRKNLETRVGIVLGRPLDKTHQVSDWGRPDLSDEQIRYACIDAIATWDLHHAQIPMIRLRTQDDGENCAGIYTMMAKAVRGTATITQAGIEFDAVKHHKLATKMEADYLTMKNRVMAELTKLYDPETPVIENIGSNAQWNKFLKAQLGPNELQAWPKTDSGALSVSGDNLKVALGYNRVPPYLRSAIEAASEWSDIKTKRDRLGLKYQRWAIQVGVQRWRIFPGYMIGGAETGRYSASDPPLQQIPREDEFRELFIARPLYVLVICDYGQIEIRVAAVLSGDPTLLKAIQDGVDIHALTALACFYDHPDVQKFLKTLKGLQGLELIEIIQLEKVLEFFKRGGGKLLRQMAKPAIFGMVYGQGPMALALKIFIDAGVMVTVDAARRIQHTILKLYPGLNTWMKRMRTVGENTGLAWTPMGRCYDIGPSWYTKSVNTPCQGGAAEIMLEAMASFPEVFKNAKIDGRLVLTAHDELGAEVRIDHAERARQVMIATMSRAALDLFPTMPSYKLVEGGIGKTWKEAKANV